MVMIVAGYLLARRAVLGSFVGVRAESFGAMAMLGLNSSGELLAELVRPVNSRMFEWRPGEFARLTGYAVPALLYLAVPLVLAFRDKPGQARRRAAVALAWFWGLVFLLPFAGLSQFGPRGRLLYLPGVGLTLLAALVAGRVVADRIRAGRVAVAVALAWSVLMVPALWQRIGWWRSEMGLFRRMTVEAPGYAPGHYNLGVISAAGYDTAGAVTAYRRAVRLDSAFVPAQLNLGALLQSRGELAEAAALYRNVTRRHPEYAPAHVNLAIVLHRQGEAAGAIEELRLATQIAPTDAAAAFNLAWLYRLGGSTDSARAWAGRALALQPRDPRLQRLYDQLRRP
jgi:tetratricopeptide (TPR) repeat protein